MSCAFRQLLASMYNISENSKLMAIGWSWCCLEPACSLAGLGGKSVK